MSGNILALALLVSLCGPAAFADSAGQAISDGTTITKIKSALTSELAVSNVEVTSYAKAWNSYNPMSWVIDSSRKYRVIEFSFVDRNGKKQSLSCSLNIVSGETSVTIHSCTGGDKSLGAYSRLADYGYAAESFIFPGVVTPSGAGASDESKTSR